MKIDQYIKILSKCDLFTNIDKDELLKIFDSNEDTVLALFL